MARARAAATVSAEAAVFGDDGGFFRGVLMSFLIRESLPEPSCRDKHGQFVGNPSQSCIHFCVQKFGNARVE